MQNWLSRIDEITRTVHNNFGSLSAEDLNWQPSVDAWSIAQNLDHLIIINETYFPLLDGLKDGTYNPPFIGRIGFLVNFFGKTILKAAKPDTKSLMKTFAIWEPHASEIGTSIIDRFAEHQEKLKKQIQTSDILIEKGAVLASPARKNIVYKVEIAFEIIVSHEERHLLQAQKVLAMLKA